MIQSSCVVVVSGNEFSPAPLLSGVNPVSTWKGDELHENARCLPEGF